MRKLGINIDPGVIWGVEPFARAVAAAGFDCVFTMGTDAEYVSRISSLCRETGMEYESLHAPFHGINAMWFNDEAAEEMLAKLCLSVDLAAQHEIPIVVAHLSSRDDAPHVTDAGIENFIRFVDYAKQKGVKVAFENQRKLGNIAVIFELFENDPFVGFCWDVGHEKCFAYGREYMPLFGKRCIYTHIHDNHCAHEGDEHLMPFDGAIDYEKTALQIAKAGYRGTLTLELALPEDTGDRYADLTAPEYAQMAFAAVDRIRQMCEEAEKA